MQIQEQSAAAKATGHNPLVEQQVSQLLDRADAEPDKTERWKLLQRVRDLAFSLRFPAKGHSIWPPLVFAASIALVIAIYIAAKTRRVFYYQYPRSYVRVIQSLDPCRKDGSCGPRYLMQVVVDGVPNPPTEMHFSEAKHFEAGHVLGWLRYTDLGSVQVIDGWDTLKDEKTGLPVLAPNCKPDYTQAKEVGHVLCEGGKARFE